jgi:predicted phage terminase large subunit-like protein
MFRARKGAEFKVAPHHVAICHALERVVIGRTRRLIINVPPRSGKTELAVKNFLAWCMGNFPDCEFIHASYSKRLATTNTWEARAIMQHEAFADVFGAPAFRDDSNAKDEFRTEQGGIVYAAGSDGTITGYGAGKMRDAFGGCILIDDPHKAGEGNSDTMRKNVIDWFSTTMESRKNSPDTPIVLIMQRLHEMDLSGWLLSGGNGEKWEHLNIAARDQSGSSFWPEQFPTDMLNRLERSNSYVFAGQYMQSPAPIGGGILKDEWWQYYTVPPALEYRTIYADTAQKTGTQNDYSVIQCWGRSRAGQAVLLDQIRGKWEAPELLIQARAFWAKHKPGPAPLRAFKVEDKVSGTGLIQTLKREGIPMLSIQRDRDKVTRAYDAAPMIESGNVLLPRDAPFLSELLAEASVFPNGQHDDQLDPLFDAVADMLNAPEPFFAVI